MTGPACSRCGQEWPRHPALEVACPDCHQPAGHLCERPSGHKVWGEPHVKRERQAMREGFLVACSGDAEARSHAPRCTCLDCADELADRAHRIVRNALAALDSNAPEKGEPYPPEDTQGAGDSAGPEADETPIRGAGGREEEPDGWTLDDVCVEALRRGAAADMRYRAWLDRYLEREVADLERRVWERLAHPMHEVKAEKPGPPASELRQVKGRPPAKPPLVFTPLPFPWWAWVILGAMGAALTLAFLQALGFWP